MNDEPIRVLSLGAGVQSTVVLLLSCTGVLPRIDHAVFADTQWEPPWVYEHLDWLKTESAKYDIPVSVVTRGNIREDALNKQVGLRAGGESRFASMPLRVLNPDGTEAMVRRQCTREYKVEPLERFTRRVMLGLKPKQRAPKEHVVDIWMGISFDETQRMKDSKNAWSRHVYPLVGYPDEYLSKPWTRLMCEDWLRANYPDRVVRRSACIGCPYHSNKEWREIREHPEVWSDAVDFDAKIRKMAGFDGTNFLHRDLKPLDEVDLRTDTDRGQFTFGFGEECEGMCGV